MYLYVNGFLVADSIETKGQNAKELASSSDSFMPLTIGRNRCDTHDSTISGYIQSIRISKKAVYTACFNSPDSFGSCLPPTPTPTPTIFVVPIQDEVNAEVDMNLLRRNVTPETRTDTLDVRILDVEYSRSTDATSISNQIPTTHSLYDYIVTNEAFKYLVNYNLKTINGIDVRIAFPRVFEQDAQYLSLRSAFQKLNNNSDDRWVKFQTKGYVDGTNPGQFSRYQMAISFPHDPNDPPVQLPSSLLAVGDYCVYLRSYGSTPAGAIATITSIFTVYGAGNIPAKAVTLQSDYGSRDHVWQYPANSLAPPDDRGDVFEKIEPYVKKIYASPDGILEQISSENAAGATATTTLVKDLVWKNELPSHYTTTVTDAAIPSINHLYSSIKLNDPTNPLADRQVFSLNTSTFGKILFCKGSEITSVNGDGKPTGWQETPGDSILLTNISSFGSTALNRHYIFNFTLPGESEAEFLYIPITFNRATDPQEFCTIDYPGKAHGFIGIKTSMLPDFENDRMDYIITITHSMGNGLNLMTDSDGRDADTYSSGCSGATGTNYTINRRDSHIHPQYRDLAVGGNAYQSADNEIILLDESQAGDIFFFSYIGLEGILDWKYPKQYKWIEEYENIPAKPLTNEDPNNPEVIEVEVTDNDGSSVTHNLHVMHSAPSYQNDIHPPVLLIPKNAGVTHAMLLHYTPTPTPTPTPFTPTPTPTPTQ